MQQKVKVNPAVKKDNHKSRSMKFLFAILFFVFGLNANAQITKASLQASGLTCSMCSKAVKIALEQVSFVEKVQVDIKKQQYNLSFKEGADVNPDALSKAVQDAGFSVASLNITANVSKMQLSKDDHVKIGGQYFHFLNGNGKQLNGIAYFNIVDKGFVSDKEYKKHAALTKMQCIKTGKMAKCCTSEEVPAQTRVFHVII